MYNASSLYIMTQQDYDNYSSSQLCGLCDRNFDFWESTYLENHEREDLERKYRKVFHHNHSALGTTPTAGRFICAAHNVCNMQAKTPMLLSSIFHNKNKSKNSCEIY